MPEIGLPLDLLVFAAVVAAAGVVFLWATRRSATATSAVDGAYAGPGDGVVADPPDDPPRGATWIVRYKGEYEQSSASFGRHAPLSAERNWYPISLTYVPGTWGLGTWVIALLLLFLVVGIVVLVYMIVVRPPGELVVIYEYRPPRDVTPTQAAQAATDDPTASIEGRIERLDALRASGALTDGEYAAKRAEILASL
jgi:hypothetical protein